MCLAYWGVVITWFYSTGCREFASSRAYSKWMDLKALHDIFRFQHCIIVAKINWTQQFWIGNQFINTEECKFTSLDLIMIMLIHFRLLILIMVAEMLQYSISYYNFMFNVWIFVIQYWINHNYYNIDRTQRTRWLVKNPCFIRVVKLEKACFIVFYHVASMS